mmetsp:Transcript_49522/g.98950  ORF Transcript_49522/g.98950 Transcript_49522/m.98950 type:complete len:123 (-) Transcript_49522:80-448(-)
MDTIRTIYYYGENRSDATSCARTPFKEYKQALAHCLRVVAFPFKTALYATGCAYYEILKWSQDPQEAEDDAWHGGFEERWEWEKVYMATYWPLIPLFLPFIVVDVTFCVAKTIARKMAGESG